MKKSLKPVKPSILELNGRELEEELERIVAGEPLWNHKIHWTNKQDLIIKKLRGRVPGKTIAKYVGVSKSTLDTRVNALKEKGFLKE